jgi:hypothetical protein
VEAGTNDIYNPSSPNGKIRINTNTQLAALEVVGYTNVYRIDIGATTSNGYIYGSNHIYSNGLFQFFSANSITDEIATFHKTQCTSCIFEC